MAANKTIAKQETAVASVPQVGGVFVSSRRIDILKDDAGDAQSNALIYEDEFKAHYGIDYEGVAGVKILEPPVVPKTLEALCQQNNTLGLCINAMVTNVHETGFTIERKEGTTEENDPEVKRILAFLDEVWPGQSFQQLRKSTGQDKERSGNAYWEVLRNLPGKMQMLRKLDAKITRMVAMSEVFDVRVSINRGGEVVTLRVPMRYRRFAQRLGARVVFFKEYGCPLLINKRTGKLMEDTPANRLELLKKKEMGTEVIHFRKDEDVDTPYGVPTWYPQMPSVLGSRKAEEHNLDYFDAGGVPPIMIFVQGGQLAQAAKEALQEFLSAKPGAKQGAPVFEVASTGGSLDGSGAGAAVKVTVERFGTERQKDSMFEQYDDKCEERVRRSWRLPPIFVGKADDYNLATAQASYAVAEAQVFKPDRDEFDATMNATIMRELDPTGTYVMRSKGIPVKDVNQQITAINAAWAADAITVQDYISLLNEVTALSMKLRPEAVAEQAKKIEAKLTMADGLAKAAGQPKTPPGQPGQSGKTSGPSGSSPAPQKGKPKLTVVKEDIDVGLELAREMFGMIGKASPQDLMQITAAVSKLDLDGQASFRAGMLEQVFEGAVASDDVARYTSAALMTSLFADA